MLETITPFEFIGRTPTGKTKPAFVVSANAENEPIEVVLKLSASSERGVGGLAMEAVVACLAGDLGLPIPQPFVAELTPAFIEAAKSVDPEWGSLAQESSTRAFASKRAPAGFTTWVAGGKVPPASQVTAASILMLDAVAKNADRRPENPNLLVRGEEFRIIDHELCFPAFLLTLGNAWDIGGLQGMTDPEWHILRDGLKGQDIEWDSAINRWQSLTDDMIEGYAAALPVEWAESAQSVGSALDRIKQARDNVENSAIEIQRILKC